MGERGLELGHLDRGVGQPRRLAAMRVDGESSSARKDGLWHSVRWSKPVMYAGRSTSRRARSPVASTMAAAPSVMGGTSCRRSG